MRVGEAHAAEIRHRVGLAPDHIVHDPEAEILQDRADAEDVVIGADHPDGAGILQHAARGGEPIAGEAVIVGEAADLVPGIIDRIDLGIVRAVQRAFQLQIVGRVGEDEIGAALRQRAHRLNAIAFDNPVRTRMTDACHCAPRNIHKRGAQ